MTGGRLRPARPTDAAAIAAIHVRSWRATYRGILPDPYLDGPVEDERLAHWTALLRDAGAGDLVLVLEDASGPIGFVAGRMPCEDGYDACVDNLHLDPRHRGGGLGRRLLGAAADAFLERGGANLFLWLFDGNDPAARFYARLGGIAVERGFDDFAGARPPHTRIVFPDLSALSMACRIGRELPPRHLG